MRDYLYFYKYVLPEIEKNPIGYIIFITIILLVWIGIKIYQWYSDKKEWENYIKKIKERVDKNNH